MAKNSEYTPVCVAANIDKRTFSHFAVYDSLGRKKAWRSPLLFALIMSAFALMCFFGFREREGSRLLGGVLLGVGLFLPLIWFGMFFSSVNRQAKRSGLSPLKTQYVVTLSPAKIHVEKGKEAADFQWEDVHMARRVEDCVYLYVSPTRAFLLPVTARGTDRAWELITQRLEPAKVTDTTK